MMTYKKNEDIYIKQSTDEIILFIHGIFASHVQFQSLIKLFKEKGYSIYAVSLKGHGESYKALKKLRYYDWTNQIDHIIDKLTNEYNKVYVIAHSLGSLLTLNSKHTNKVAKAVLLAPAIKTKVSLKSILLALKINSTSTKNDYLTQSQKVNGIEFPRFYHNVFGIRPLIELQKMIRVTKKQLSNYQVDSIIVISKNDETVRFSSGQYVFNCISSKQKDLIVLDKSYHTILHKNEEAILYDRIIDFIKGSN